MLVTFAFQWKTAIVLDYSYDCVGEDNFAALWKETDNLNLTKKIRMI